MGRGRVVPGSRVVAPRDHRRRPGRAAHPGPDGGGVRRQRGSGTQRAVPGRFAPRHAALSFRGRRAQRHSRARSDHRSRRAVARPRRHRPPALPGHVERQVRRGCTERRAAPARRLREPHTRRASSRARLSAAGDVRLPERRDSRNGSDQGGVAPAHSRHPGGADLPEPDRLRRRCTRRRSPPRGRPDRSWPIAPTSTTAASG